MARTAFTEHDGDLSTAPLSYQIITELVNQPTLLCGRHASSAPGLALPVLGDLK